MKFIHILYFVLAAFYNIHYASTVDVTVIYRLNDPDLTITDGYIGPDLDNEVNSINEPVITNDNYIQDFTYNPVNAVVPNAEAHIRTNALGLFQDVPFSEHISNENVQYNFSACYAIRDICEWEKHGWKLVPYASPNGRISSDSSKCTVKEKFECDQLQFYNLQKIGTVTFASYGYYQAMSITADGYSYIKVIFDDPNLQYCDDIDISLTEIYDYNDHHNQREGNIYSFSGHIYEKQVTANGTVLLIQYRNSCRNSFQVSYYGGTGTAYALTGSSGYMESTPFIPYTSKLCIGIGYKVTNISISDIYVTIRNENFEKSMARHETYNYGNSIYYTTFLADLSKNEERSQIKIYVRLLTKTEHERPVFFLNMIERCSLGENIQKIHILDDISFNIHRVPKEESSDADIQKIRDILSRVFGVSKEESSDAVCINGGVWSSEEESCLCPAGFTGEFCETGCGPNRYGDDCTGECSRFLDECKGLLMCKYGISCYCAPGFKGQFCNISCSPGEYGANCENKCHNCLNGTQCDPYTGYCNSGCEKGYHSPLCYYKYQYLDVAPEVSLPTFDTISVTVLFRNISGVGNAKYYQVQYKDIYEKLWSKADVTVIPNQLKSDIIEITGLKAGHLYRVRAVLIDKDLDSYDGKDIPNAFIKTQCIIPDEVDYKLESYSVSQTSFNISWKYDSPHEATSCPLYKFEVYVKEDWRWLLYWTGSENETKINNLLSGETYFIKVRAVTINGPANSEVLAVTTVATEPRAVSDLKVTKSEADRIGLKWQPPKYSAANIKGYIVKYQCKQLLGCPDENCTYVNGQFKATTPHAIINGLLPHAQYEVSVAPISVSVGPALTRKVSTDQAVPNLAPDRLQRQVYHRTNSSFTVSWKYPSSCKALNGFFSHYEYDLVESVSEQGYYNTSILKGSTRNTSMTFRDLEPHSTYYVKVYIVTSAGINLSYLLVIKSDTKAAVPGFVQNLTVYKKGRKMVGLRWAAPTELHGTLQSFTVSYKNKNFDDIYTYIVEPLHCPGWAHLYCYTVTSLSADNEYIFTVSARNSEIPEDGDQVSISAVTKEEAPGVPTRLEILSQTDHSILIQWKLPHLLNGVLRSFLITIEETDSYNTTDCCQDFPLKTLTVRKEETHYTYQFTDLRSASTYTISISAKTTVIGPAVVITGHTKPPLVSMNGTIEILQDNSQQSGITVKLSPVQQYVDLIRGYLLLVIPQNDTPLPDTITEVQTKDEVLTNELLDITDDPFYIAAEFQQNDLLNNREVQLGTGSSPVIGVISNVQDPYLTKGSKYKLALAVILQYCGIYNVPHVFTPVVIAN